MNERLKLLRNTLGFTQQQFAEKLGVKRNTIAQYEIGRNEPIDSVVNLIVREYHVNEDWLRNGHGEMFIAPSRDERIVDFVNSLQFETDESFKKRLISVLSGLNVDEWKVLEDFAKKLFEEREEK
ncbi:MAG: helix-turn-helix domain-containing protein [Lachnospiraceae bacterium]|nr:helix-turn-helix domain-containing protein [Lachnospiraceae bacterium]